MKAGRKKSVDMEVLEVKIQKYQDKEKAITAKVDVKELIAKGNKLNETLNSIMDELEAVAKEMEKTRLAAIPEDMKKEHYALMAERERAERDRNKIFLKVQKIKDKAVPRIKKILTPLLQEYEDIETVVPGKSEGELNVDVFNHLEQWKTAFKDKKTKK